MHVLLAALATTSFLPLIFSAPLIEKRALSENDTNTLQLALYLEHLEYALYSGGFNAFTDAQYEADGFPPGFRGKHRRDYFSRRTPLTAFQSLTRANPLAL